MLKLWNSSFKFSDCWKSLESNTCMLDIHVYLSDWSSGSILRSGEPEISLTQWSLFFDSPYPFTSKVLSWWSVTTLSGVVARWKLRVYGVIQWRFKKLGYPSFSKPLKSLIYYLFYGKNQMEHCTAQYLLVINFIGRVVPVVLHKNFGIVPCTNRDSVVLIQAFTILTKSPSSYHITPQRWHSTCLRGTPFICVHKINCYIFPGLFFTFFSHSRSFMTVWVLRLGSWIGFSGLGFSVDWVLGLWCEAIWVFGGWSCLYKYIKINLGKRLRANDVIEISNRVLVMKMCDCDGKALHVYVAFL